MVVRKKPKNLEQESMINAVIQAGGSLSKSRVSLNKPHRLTFRIPEALKTQVDLAIDSDTTQPSLTAWILEAMKQRLKNEN